MTKEQFLGYFAPPLRWLRKFIRSITKRGWVLFTLAILTWTLLLPWLPWSYEVRCLGLLVAFFSFAYLATSGQKQYTHELLTYLVEAAVAAGVAWGLVVVLSGEGERPPHEHIAVGVALAIVLSGISALARSARAIGRAERRFTSGAKRLDKIYKGAEAASTKTDSAAEHVEGVATALNDTVALFKQEVDRAHLVSLAARAVMLRSDTMEYKPVQNAVSAALGTIRTWAQSSRKGFDANTKGKNKCSPSEATWWRCLESYHNEERYDLARFELVTNTRNYTYILNAILDEIRSSVGLVPDKRGNVKRSTQEVVIVQCSTFAPKDFYNFPLGPKGDRTYRDFEFYGTYRRSVSFMNRQIGMLPHRLVFVADDSGTDKEKKENENRLERMGWVVDPPRGIALSCARLYCAPYAMPVADLDQDGGPRRLFDHGWTTDEATGDDPPEGGKRTGYGKFHICPVARIETPPDDEERRAWGLRARDHDARMLHGKDYDDLDEALQEEVLALQKRSPQELAVNEPVEFLLRRESWAWDEIVKPAFADTNNPDSHEDLQGLKDAYTDLGKSRDEMIKRVAEFSTTGSEAKLTGLVRELVPRSQRFDAACAELQSSSIGDKSEASSRWRNLQSMTGLRMGAGELWLYHALNYINAVLFKNLAQGRKMLPIWDLFCWDFLGMSGSRIAGGAHRKWMDGEDGVGSRIRFIKVRPGQFGDAEEQVSDGRLSAHAFDKKGYQREFTLVGLRPWSDNDRPSLEGVTWTLLLTNEMAPPFSTCRLNFYFGHSESAEATSTLQKYSDWVERAWKESEKESRDVFSRIEKELEDHDLPEAAE